MFERYLRYHRHFGVSGLVRLIRTQIAGHELVLDVRSPDCDHPLHLRIPGSDEWTYSQVYVNREYEFRAGRNLDVIVDAGANIGLASVRFATRFPQAKIIAIEPERKNFEMLQRNVEKYPNVVAVHAALWDRSGEIELVDPGLGNWGFMTGDQERSDRPVSEMRHKVPAVTIPEIIERFGLDRIDLLKVDIEGAEREVFQDSSSWIGKVDSLVVELHDRLKSGCSRSFYQGTPGFDLEWSCNENIYLSRKGTLLPPG